MRFLPYQYFVDTSTFIQARQIYFPCTKIGGLLLTSGSSARQQRDRQEFPIRLGN